MRYKVVAFDLDDVLCYRSPEATGDIDKYKTCEPNQNMIDLCNKCFNSGCEVIIYTARGMSTQGGDVNKVYSKLYQMTTSQLKDWGVKYHQLIMGKVHYDILIDDKAFNYTGNNEASISELLGV